MNLIINAVIYLCINATQIAILLAFHTFNIDQLGLRGMRLSKEVIPFTGKVKQTGRGYINAFLKKFQAVL